MILLDKDYALEKAENQYQLNIIDEQTKIKIVKFINSLPSAQPELAQDLPNACTDAISRQAAIELATQYCPDDDGTCSKADEDIRNLLDELEALPSAQPERKKGKWVTYDGDWFKTMFKCSECGAMIDIDEKDRNFFCYHCGADMRGDDDGE